jgi:hypothetical protein
MILFLVSAELHGACLISCPRAAQPTGLAVANHGQVLLGNISCLIHMYLTSQVR